MASFPSKRDVDSPESSWTAIRLTVPEEIKALVTDRLWALGAAGVQEDHPGLHPDEEAPRFIESGWEVPEGVNPTDRVELCGWFEPSCDLGTVRCALEAALKSMDQEVRLQVESIVTQDWNTAWKEGWTATRLSRHLVVVPSWLEPHGLDGSDRVIRLDPGVAFGTGTHATTRLCAEVLDAELSARPGLSVFDIGTGSGVLSLGAQLLGASSVLGLDTDARAVEAAQSNAQANGLSGAVDFQCGTIQRALGSADLVLGNLLKPILEVLRDSLCAATRPGGLLVLSGILDSQADSVIALFSDPDFEPGVRRDLEGWSVVTVRRRGGQS